MPDLRFFIDSLEAGGNERDCFHLCNGLAERGLSVELLLVRARGVFLEQLDPGVLIRSFEAKRALHAFWPVSGYLRRSGRVPILVFGFHLAVGLLATRQMRLHNSPIIYREGSSPRANIRKTMLWAYRWLIARSDRVIAQSRSGAEELRSLGVSASKISVLSNPGPSKPASFFSEERSGLEAPLILGVGRLSPEKGFDRLIRAFKSLHEHIPSARLVILGEGGERNRLESLIRESGLTEVVSLPGFVQDVRSWYARASLFVLSSYYEGQPNVLIEAILSQCPVLCAEAKGGVADLLEGCALQDCLVSEAEFEPYFTERVDHVLGKRRESWQEARERLLERVSPDAVLPKYLEACGVRLGVA